MDKICLITGANGFVGSALCQEISRRYVDSESDLQVRAAVRFSGSVLKKAVYSVAEIGEINSTTDWLQALFGIDCVIHAAARAHCFKDSATSPIEEFRKVNVAGTIKLAQQCLELNIRRFIYISSIGVNGDETKDSPFNEECPPNPIGPYAVSKMEAEAALKKIFLNSRTELVIVRPTLIYGGNPPGNFGRLFKAIRLGYPLPLGMINNQRSFIGIDNFCDFIITCIDHPLAADQTFLISDGLDVSTTELLINIGYAFNKPLHLIPCPSWLLMGALKLCGKAAMAKQLVGDLRVDITKSRKVLNWSPLLTLQEGLRNASRY